MRPIRALVIYVAVVFLGGGLLAPWLYWLAQSFSHVLLVFLCRRLRNDTQRLRYEGICH